MSRASLWIWFLSLCASNCGNAVRMRGLSIIIQKGIWFRVTFNVPGPLIPKLEVFRIICDTFNTLKVKIEALDLCSLWCVDEFSSQATYLNFTVIDGQSTLYKCQILESKHKFCISSKIILQKIFNNNTNLFSPGEICLHIFTTIAMPFVGQ